MSEQKLKESKLSLNNPNTIDYPIIAVDYGKRRIGLAVSDSKGIVSQSLPIIQWTRKKDEADMVSEILTTAEEYKAKSILFGLPQDFEEAHKEIQVEIKAFASLFETESEIKILFTDESYSSKQAEDMLLSFGKSRKNSKNNLDSVAAAIFLQGFLDQLRK